MQANAKIIALILSCKGTPWEQLEEKGVRKTWYEQVDGIETIFYYGDSLYNRFEGDKLFLTCKELCDNIGIKTILALERVLNRYPNFKYIFRTNLSSYVRLDRLSSIVDALPSKKAYAGLIGNHNGIPFASGCGYFLSRDLVELLVNSREVLEYSYMDDVCFGKFLTGKGIKIVPMPRFDIVSMEHLKSITINDIKDHFHFRCKQEYDRKKDVIVMERLYQLLKGGI